MYVPVELRACMLYLSLYPILAGLARERRIYNTMRHHFFLQHMQSNLHTTVEDYGSCGQNGSQTKHDRKLRLFPAVGPLELVAMDILGPLLKTTLANRHVVVATDHYSIHTSGTPTEKITLTHIGSIFFGHLMFSTLLYFFFVAKWLTTIGHHPQSNSQVDR